MAFSAPAERGTVAEINITPLVDVMLVLLVIFMVTAPMLSGALKLDLPQPPPPKSAPPDTLTLDVLASGELRWAGQPVPLSAVDALLRLEAGQPEPRILELRSDPEVEYQRVTDLMARAQRAGLERIAL